MEEKIKEQIYKQIERLGQLTDKILGYEKLTADGISRVRDISDEMVTLAYFLINNKRG